MYGIIILHRRISSNIPQNSAGEVLPMDLVTTDKDGKTIEVRGFLQFDEIFRKNGWPRPLIIDLEEPITGTELAEKLGFPIDEIEIVFVNGLAQSVDCYIQPGDRVAFMPPGCPGPYRICLGFYGKNQDNQFNFIMKK
jgi:Mut7-C ubiquitin